MELFSLQKLSEKIQTQAERLAEETAPSENGFAVEVTNVTLAGTEPGHRTLWLTCCIRVESC